MRGIIAFSRWLTRAGYLALVLESNDLYFVYKESDNSSQETLAHYLQPNQERTRMARSSCCHPFRIADHVEAKICGRKLVSYVQLM